MPPGDVIVVVNPTATSTVAWTEPDSGAQISITFPAGVVDQLTTFRLVNLPALSTNPVGFTFAGSSFVLDAYRNNIRIDNFQFLGDGIMIKKR